eukprot:287406-Prorocentrum_lima.AAC.1
MRGQAGAPGRCTLVFHAAELWRPSKTGELDVSVSLDLARQQWLIPYLAGLTKGRSPSDFLFDVSYQELAQVFHQAVQWADV